MKTLAIIVIIALIVIFGFIFYKTALRESPPKREIPLEKEMPVLEKPAKKIMEIKSPAFENNGSIPSKYTCDGQDINPPLEISNIPAGTESLVLIVDDPDAPGGTFLHWMVWNIPPETAKIEEGSLPQGAIEGKNGFEKKGYGGPCPPSGEHRYFFKLYALSKKLEIPEDVSEDELKKIISGTIIEKSELIGRYRR